VSSSCFSASRRSLARRHPGHRAFVSAAAVAWAAAAPMASDAAAVLDSAHEARGSSPVFRRAPRRDHHQHGVLPPLGLLALACETHSVVASELDVRYAVQHNSNASTQLVAQASAEGSVKAAPTIAGANASLAAAVAEHKLPSKSWFALTFSFAFVIKALCMASNVIFQVSPIPQVMQFNKAGDTGEVDPAPFISILYGGCQWCFYGMFAYLVTQKSGFLVLVYSNVLGALLGFYYLWGFQRNCRNKQSMQSLRKYLQAASVVALTQLVAMTVLPCHKALFLCGLASCVCSVVGACSLLATLPKILETQCSVTINLPLVCVGIASAILWLICGLLLLDAWIIVPNIGSICVSACTLSLAAYFPRDPEVAAALVAAAASASATAQAARGSHDCDGAADASDGQRPVATSPPMSLRSEPVGSSGDSLEDVRGMEIGQACIDSGDDVQAPLLRRAASASGMMPAGGSRRTLLGWRPSYGSDGSGMAASLLFGSASVPNTPPGLAHRRGAALLPLTTASWSPPSPEVGEVQPRGEPESPMSDEVAETGGTGETGGTW